MRTQSFHGPVCCYVILNVGYIALCSTHYILLLDLYNSDFLKSYGILRAYCTNIHCNFAFYFFKMKLYIYIYKHTLSN